MFYSLKKNLLVFDFFSFSSEKQYEDYLKDLAEARDLAASRGRGGRRGAGVKNPLERGWTGGRLGGRHFGPPQAANRAADAFAGFDSVLLQFRTVFKMTGNLGRVRRTSFLMVSGVCCCASCYFF
jgi:hypothetical protein